LCGIAAIHSRLGTAFCVAHLVLIMAVSGFAVVHCYSLVIAGSFSMQGTRFIGLGHSVFSKVGWWTG
jgi:hypothetical protein